MPPRAARPDAGPTDWTTLSTLMARVMRAFYDPKTTAIMDALAKGRRMGLKDEHLQSYIKLPIKEINRICHRLVDERLVRLEQRMELTRVDGRRVGRSYFVVDWRNLIDVTKYKLWSIRRDLEQRSARARADMGYQCPLCHARYSPLDAPQLLDARTGVFRCTVCQTEVVESGGADGGAEGQLARFMQQTRPLLDSLKAADALTLPEPCVDALALPEADRTQLSGKVTARLILAPARAPGSDAGAAAVELRIVFGDSDEAQKREREKAALSQRRQGENRLPIWHQISTVTGERIRADPPGGPVRAAADESAPGTPVVRDGLCADDLAAMDAWYRRQRRLVDDAVGSDDELFEEVVADV